MNDERSLWIVFQADDVTYGLDAGRIVELAPVPELQPIPQTAPPIAGRLNYRGALATVIDLTHLLAGRPSRLVYSTRLIMVEVDGLPVGLLAEHATESRVIERARLQPPRAGPSTPAFLGPVLRDNERMIQGLLIEPLTGAALTHETDNGHG